MVHYYATSWFNTEFPRCLTAVSQYLCVAADENCPEKSQIRILNHLKIWFENGHNNSKRFNFLTLSLQYCWSFPPFGSSRTLGLLCHISQVLLLPFVCFLIFFTISLKFSKFSSWLYLTFSLFSPLTGLSISVISSELSMQMPPRHIHKHTYTHAGLCQLLILNFLSDEKTQHKSLTRLWSLVIPCLLLNKSVSEFHRFFLKQCSSVPFYTHLTVILVQALITCCPDYYNYVQFDLHASLFSEPSNILLMK